MNMDTFYSDDNHAMNADNSSPSSSSSSSSSSHSSCLRFHGFRAIKKLFRILELSFVFFFLAWASTRLPFAVRISSEYFRRLISLVLSHFFIFLLSNVIVLTLFLKSQKLINIAEEDGNMDLCQEFIGNIDADGGRNYLIAGETEDIVYQDKRTILQVPRVVTRSRSENLRRSAPGKMGNKLQLRRSVTETETERRRRRAVVDELSNEEFRRAIEGFIARQMKFHREEKLAIVVHG